MDEGKKTFDIDVIITWVDGNDEALNAKRAAYITPEEANEKDIAAPTRYANRGEINWCIRSINKFMPWVRRIFLVTDGQNPDIQSRIPIEIIDHKVIIVICSSSVNFVRLFTSYTWLIGPMGSISASG